jgi:hypothetical protein
VDEDEVKRDFGKIIRRVAESTAIDKKYLWMQMKFILLYYIIWHPSKT